MKIEKKVQAKYFKAVLEGRKPFEIRLADFKCNEGDMIVFREQKDGTRLYTGRKLECEVTYKINTKKLLKFYSQKDMDKYGLLILAVRRKYKYR